MENINEEYLNDEQSEEETTTNENHQRETEIN